MSRRGLTAIIATLAMFAIGAQAQAALYVGKVKGDPGSEVSFKTIKQDNGNKKVTEMEFDGLDADCADGDGSLGGPIYAEDGRIRDNEFDVEYKDSLFNQRFAGELKPNDKASGIVKVRADFELPTGTCRTDKLEWTATKAVN